MVPCSGAYRAWLGDSLVADPDRRTVARAWDDRHHSHKPRRRPHGAQSSQENTASEQCDHLVGRQIALAFFQNPAANAATKIIDAMFVNSVKTRAWRRAMTGARGQVRVEPVFAASGPTS